MKHFVLLVLAIAMAASGCAQEESNSPEEARQQIMQEAEVTETAAEQAVPEQETEAAEAEETSEAGKEEEQPKEEVKYATGYTEHPQEMCKGTKVKFDYPPVNLEKTKVFLPLGAMSGSHVTPTDHHYFQDFDNTEADIEVYSPGDGMVTSIGHMPGAPEGEDYRVTVRHTCTIQSIYIHIHTLSEKLEKAFSGERSYPDIPVRAGEAIGYYSKNVDYNLVDEEVTLSGFAVPEHYEGEQWKIHVPNTLEYFNEPVKAQLTEKLVRTKQPLAGKIDYDIDGKLVGNWFLEGTDGYKGDNPNGYWKGHLTLAYNHLDPDRVMVSMGDYNGKEAQFAAKGNAPDPARIGVEDGLVKYELVDIDYLDKNGRVWDRKSPVKIAGTKEYDRVHGTVLAQLIAPGKLKFEAFPGKTAGQASGFTANAKIYER